MKILEKKMINMFINSHRMSFKSFYIPQLIQSLGIQTKYIY